jgi:hypothetical protein
LMSQGLLKQEQLRQAMSHTRESFFFSLAEVLIGSGVISLAKLELILHDYCRKLRLGELALAQGLISEEQLELALAMLDTQAGRIGEVFVELHFATPHQIDQLLEFQRRCRVEAAVG